MVFDEAKQKVRAKELGKLKQTLDTENKNLQILKKAQKRSSSQKESC